MCHYRPEGGASDPAANSETNYDLAQDSRADRELLSTLQQNIALLADICWMGFEPLRSILAESQH